MRKEKRKREEEMRKGRLMRRIDLCRGEKIKKDKSYIGGRRE